MWVGNIEVEFKIRSLRIGSGMTFGNVDLPTLSMRYSGSSIKGILRKAAKKVMSSIGGHDPEVENVIFGDKNREGKIQIVVLGDSNAKNNTRFGIRIDPKTGSVKTGHLFSYSYLRIDNLRFLIRPVLPLNNKEVTLIYHALNFLRYETLGGFGSRGFGLIEDVRISESFREYVQGVLS